MIGAAIRTGAVLIAAVLAQSGAALAEIDPATAAAELAIARRAAADGHMEKALAYTGRAAKAGSGAGLSLLAEFYETGRGVLRDPARAAKLYRKALDVGFNPAGARLGRLYSTGVGVERDANAARHWFRRAALLLPPMADRAGFVSDWMGAGGVPDALFEALAWADRVHGSSAAERYRLSEKYRTGKGAHQDTAMADHLLAGAFYQGVPEADFYHALALLTSHEGRAKIALGVDLLHAAAVAGLGDAQNALAMRHLAGKDVDQSDVAAWYWLRRAKTSGIEVGRALYRLERYISAEDRKLAEWRMKENFIPEVD